MGKNGRKDGGTLFIAKSNIMTIRTDRQKCQKKSWGRISKKSGDIIWEKMEHRLISTILILQTEIKDYKLKRQP